MSKHPALRRRRTVFTSLVALTLAMGCATASANREEEQRLKQARSHLNLGIDYLRTDRVELGLRELLIAESFDPKNARIQFGLGDAYLVKGKFEEAELHYLRVLELVPDFHDARLNLAALYLQQSRFEESLALSQQLADDATFPAPWRALANQGWAEYKLGQVDLARGTLERAQDFKPNYWPSMLSLGILEMEQGRRLEAVSLFREVLENGPAPSAAAEANYRMGEIYVALGKRDRAVRHLMAAVASAPGGQWGSKSEEYLKLLR